MPDGRKLLSHISGLSEKEVDNIWKEVRANHDRLSNCKGSHEFEETAGAKLRGKYRCWKCGGTVDTSAFKWYTEGLKHGKANSIRRVAGS